MDQFNQRLNEFSLYNNGNTDNSNLLSDGIDLPRFNESDVENYISGDNLSFLHQKLSEVTALNSTHIQRESKLKNKIDELQKEKHELNKKCETFVGEHQNLKNTQELLRQKVDAETRQRFLYQDKVTSLGKELQDEQEAKKELDNKFATTQKKLTKVEAYAKEIFVVAEQSAKQVEAFNKEMRIYEEMLQVAKSSIVKTNEENDLVRSELCGLNNHLIELGDAYNDASTDIQSFKEENLKHETYVNDTLCRFKEITNHFSSMKDQFLVQGKELERNTIVREELISELKETKTELKKKKSENEDMRKSSMLQGSVLNKTVDELQSNLKSLVDLNNDLDGKNKTCSSIIDELKEENIKFKAETESLKTILAVEKSYNTEKKMCVERFSNERNEWKQKHDFAAEELKLSEKREDELNLKIKETNEHIKQLIDENNELQHMMEKLEEENRWFSDERKEFSEMLTKKGKEIEDHVGDMTNSEKLLEKKQNDLIAMDKQLCSIKDEKVLLEREKFEISKDLETSKQKEVELNGKIKEMEDRVIKCQFVFMDNEKKYSELTEKCDKLVNDSRVDKSSIAELNAEIGKIKLKNHECEQRKEKLEEDLKDAKELLSNTVADSNKKAQLNNENIKLISTDIKREMEQYKKYCDEKDETISLLTTKVGEMEKSSEEKNLKIVEVNGKISSLEAKNESLTDTVRNISEEKQEYITIIENFTRKEGTFRKDIETKLIQIKDLEFQLAEQRREFKQYQFNMDTYDSIWNNERNQALKDIEDELDRETSIFQPKFDFSNVGVHNTSNLKNSKLN